MQTLAIFGLTIVTATSVAAEDTYFQKGLNLHKQGQYELAAAMYTTWLGSHGNDQAAYSNRGNAYDSLGQFDKAISDFDRAIALKPDDESAYYNRGNCYRTLGQFEKSIADFDKAIGLKPDFVEAYRGRGLTYHELKQFHKAIADFDKAIALKPDYVNAYNNRGYARIGLEQYDNAISDYTKAIALKPDDKFAYINRGLALARSKKIAESFQDFETTFPQNKTNSSFYRARAVAHFISGNKSEGSADIEKALALAGTDARAKEKAERIKNEFMGQSSIVAATGQTTKPTDSSPVQSDTSPTVSKQNKDRPIGDKWALVIGISKFANPAYNLKFAAKDAKDFYNYLITEGNFKKDHVLLLLDENATQRNIKAAFGRMFLPAVARDGDLVAIYVSTHGTPASKDPGKRNYIVAHDTNAEELYETGIDMDDLSERVKEGVHTDRVLIVMDTCYSGGGVPGARGVDACGNFDAAQIAQGFGNLVISSSSPNERSWESKVSANGVFTKYLLQSLRLTHGNVKNAFDKLKDDVGWEVQNAFNQPQHPQLGGEWAGKELILSAPATTSRPILNPELLKLINLQNATTGAANPSQKIQATPKNTHH